ncbi:MAG: ketosteroid isomerase family protein [Pseudomonadota bacterium]
MKLKHFIILCTCILTLGGCAAKGSVDNAKPVVLKATSEQSLNVRDFLDSYMQTFNSRDMDSLVALYAPDASVLVFADNEGYVLDKDALLSAFEMKVDGWINKNLSFVGYDMNNVSIINSLVYIDVAFHINSTSWNGKYATSFHLKESVGQDGMPHYLIVKENM